MGKKVKPECELHGRSSLAMSCEVKCGGTDHDHFDIFSVESHKRNEEETNG